MTHAVENFALNVYCWGSESQDRLLVECLRPAVRELRRSGWVDRFWYTRFDARGPHVMTVFGGPRRCSSRARQYLTAQLDEYLVRRPSPEQLSVGELNERHRACRGKALCAVDADPELAPNNSYALADHAQDGYPFKLGAATTAHPDLWRLLDGLCLWALDVLEAGAARSTAIRWVAALDLSLERVGAHQPEDYWRYYATTVLMPLRARLESDEVGALAGIPGALGARNVAALARIYTEVAQSPPLCPCLDALAQLLAHADDLTLEERWVLLREITHFTLQQLGQPLRDSIPSVLYAWHRGATGADRGVPR